MSYTPDLPTSRTIWFGKNGSNSNDGSSPQKAVLTIAEAIIVVNALSPSPSVADPAWVACEDAGEYFEAFVLAAGVSMYAPKATIGRSTSGTCATVNDGSVLVAKKLDNSGGGTNGVTCTGASKRASVYIEHITGCAGSGAIFASTGAHIHVEIGKIDGMTTTIANALQASVSAAKISGRIGMIELTDTQKALNATSTGVIEGIFVSEISGTGGTGNTRAITLSTTGSKISGTIGHIAADESWNVPTGTELYLFVSENDGAAVAVSGTVNVTEAGAVPSTVLLDLTDVIYVDGTAGNDSNSGKNVNEPKQTIANAILSAGIDDTIVVLGDATYTEDLTSGIGWKNGLNLFAPGAALVGRIDCIGSGCHITFKSIDASGSNQPAVRMRYGHLTCETITNDGTGSCFVQGTAGLLYVLDVGQMECVNGHGVDINQTGSSVHGFVGKINVTGTGTAVRQASGGSSIRVSLHVGEITALSGTGVRCFTASMNLFVGYLSASTSYTTVGSNAKLAMFVGELIGTPVVTAGSARVAVPDQQGKRIGYTRVTAAATTYAALGSDHLIDVERTGGAGNLTITLPNAALNLGTQYIVKRNNGDTEGVTVDATASQTIDGALNVALAANETLTVVNTVSGEWIRID